MSLLTGPRTGRWTDESNHHHIQWLQSDNQAQWLKVAVAICLTLSTPYIFRIFVSSFLGFARWISSGRETSNPPRDEEVQPLTPTRLMNDAKTGRQMLRRFYDAFRQKESKLEIRHQFFYFFVLSTLCFAFFSQIIASSILTDKMTTNRMGLLASETCGLYEYDNERWGEEQASRVDSLMVKRENRAAIYAQECYDWGNDKKGKAMTCDFFYNSTLRYNVSPSSCPFDDNEICRFGALPGKAVTFDTGYLDSSLLGINANPTYTFRRTTTCAPLSDQPPYVQHFYNSPVDRGYLYQYGKLYNVDDKCEGTPELLTDYTMRIVGHPFEWLAPVYRLNTFATSLGIPSCDFYQPHRSLIAPGLDTQSRTKTLTIVFITALHIVYTQKSIDPIFPADDPYKFQDGTVEYYKNSSPKSRAFACIDETQFCDPTNTYCWHEYEKIPDQVSHIAEDPAYWFMVNALKKSNTYDSIKLRLGSSLLAQQRVGEARSQALANNHWELEAEHMFKTSLARAQFDAWSLASGEDHDQDTCKNTVDEFAEGMCGLFKFRAAGHVNIRLWPFWLLCSVLPITFLLSVELKTYGQIWHSAISSAREILPKRSNGSTSGSATGALVASDDINEDAFVVGSATSTRRSSDTPAASAVTPTGQNDLTDASASADGLEISSEAANNHPTQESMPPASTTTPLVAPTHKSRDYGTSSAAHSMHGSRSSVHTHRSGSVLNREVQSLASGEEGSRSSERNDQEWSPLLIHGPVLMVAHVTQAVGKKRTE
ncbi:hypothetical protein AA0118_g8267 [Alternaria tenuissima]|nr:hypothetical protein AA0118_g8267 [Alternaria tenuissima]